MIASENERESESVDNGLQILEVKNQTETDIDNEATIQKAEQIADAADAISPSKEFAYLERNEFTSEIYKIEVRNLGYFGIGEFKKLIKNKLKLDMTKIKSPQRKEFAFICFRNREEQLRAIETLNGYKWKGKVLQAIESKASADPLQKRRLQEKDDSASTKKQRTSAAEATCPLYAEPYDKQLEQKSNIICTLLRNYTRELSSLNTQFKQHSEEFLYDSKNMVKPSPELNGYRNKSEFTVGYNAENEIIVGFRLGSYVDGSVVVAGVQDLPHLPNAAKWAAQSFQTFMRTYPSYLPFNPEANSGHVRQLMVRTSTNNEIMLVPGIYTDNLNEEQMTQFKADLKAFYANQESDAHFRCTSLYVQDVKRRKPGQMVSPVEYLAGTKHITETMLGLKFVISPLAFFQVNTLAAEVLYQTAIELAQPKQQTVMLDICCGTGTIALAFAKHCRQVVGVDIVADAIADARRNACENNIENCKFYAGNADDLLKSMLRDIHYTYGADGNELDLIAVLDPPRSGLHSRSIATIRAATAIKRLVYLSCSPESAKRNWIDLARPESKQFRGEPFYPKKAIAVDLFPHTMHTELVILFERASSKDEESLSTNLSADAKDSSIENESKIVELTANESDVAGNGAETVAATVT